MVLGTCHKMAGSLYVPVCLLQGCVCVLSRLGIADVREGPLYGGWCLLSAASIFYFKLHASFVKAGNV